MADCADRSSRWRIAKVTPESAIRRTRADRGQLRKAHEQCADQTDGVRIFYRCSRVHDRLFIRNPIPPEGRLCQGGGSYDAAPRSPLAIS